LKAHLAAEPVQPRRTQHGLFTPAASEPEKLELTVARIRHLVGADHVGTPELRDTHHPDSFSMHAFAPAHISCAGVSDHPADAPRLCLRRFRPPRYAQVLVVNNQPVRVLSLSISGRVVMAKGPWRTSGEWWQSAGSAADGQLLRAMENAAWNRDEWDVALETGGVFRIFRDIDSNRWFVEASYD
jgi:protein ImuB